MKVYVLTEEPYHDNSALIGVYLEEKEAVTAIRAQANPKARDDCRLVEWDTDTNSTMRVWDLVHKLVSEKGPVPWKTTEDWRWVRTEYTLYGPRLADEPMPEQGDRLC